MADKIKNTFDGIRAGDDLKDKTISYLQKELQKRRKTGKSLSKKLVLSTLFTAIFFGAFSYTLYFTPAAYVDVDVNPSAEFTLNLFNRIIGVYAYNEDGQNILSELSLKHKKYNYAILTLLKALSDRGYMDAGGLVSITLQADDTDLESELIAAIKNDIVITLQFSMQVDVFAVSADTRNTAREYDISPAMYLAILELMQVDSTVTVEGCRGHSVSQIKKQTKERSKHNGCHGHR